MRKANIKVQTIGRQLTPFWQQVCPNKSEPCIADVVEIWNACDDSSDETFDVDAPADGLRDILPKFWLVFFFD